MEKCIEKVFLGDYLYEFLNIKIELGIFYVNKKINEN